VLVRLVDYRHTAHFSRLQRFLRKRHRIFVVFDNVNLLAAQLADDRLHAHAFHSHAGAHGIHVLVARHYGYLGALTGLARNGPDLHGAVIDFRDFRLEQVLHQLWRGPRNNHGRTLGILVHAHQHGAHSLAH
jgi:hypothetical protein